MSHRIRSRLLLCGLLALSFGCTDEGTGPTADHAAIALRPVFATAPATSAEVSIHRIRLTVRNAATAAVLLARTVDVDPGLARWELELEVPGVGPGMRVLVAAELINVTGGVETVMWSGVVGPITVTPGSTAAVHTVAVYPGPLDNLSVTSVTLLDVPGQMAEGDVAQLRAAVEAAAGANVRVVWSTTDPSILGVDQNGTITALLPGSARITAAAGPHRAEADITVRARPVALIIEPASARIEQLGGSVALTARAADARGGTVAGTVAWSTDSPSVLAHDGDGRFTALANGTATVTATLVGQPSITATAAIEVAQRAAIVTVEPAAVTLGARGATVQLSVNARDAGGAAIADVAIDWQSSNPAVAGVSASGLVTGNDEGTATISALVGGIAGTAQITVRTVAAMRIHAGDNQTARVATALPIVPAVRVTNADGGPVSGVAVTFAVAHGGGAVEHATAVTDASGIAQAGAWTLGTTAGPNALTAAVAGAADVTFAAMGTADVPANIAAAAGDAQTGRAGATLPIRPTVRVTDRFGNPVGGVTVGFTADNGATVTPATVVTDADGLAGAQWTLGTTTGTYTLRATAAGVGTVAFTAIAETAVPAALVVVEGDGQSAPAGSTLPMAPAVRVVDADGRPIPGVTVTFTAHGDGSSIDGGTAVTGADGVAFAGAWTLGPTPGSYTVTAAVEGLASVTFTAEATAGSAALSGVVVSATSGQPVAGALVELQSASGTHQVTTGSAGEFAFTGIAPGTWAVRVTAAGFGEFSGTVVLTDGQETTRNFAILPQTSGDAISIVLTWNEVPYDLDSHLDVPAFEGQGPFHVAYYARGSADVYPFAVLDTDQTGGYGPETITITQQLSGTYTYSVYNFSGSPDLRTSGATVEVYRGNDRIATFAVPDQPGRTWTVFSLDGATLTPINQLDGVTSQSEFPAPDAMGVAK